MKRIWLAAVLGTSALLSACGGGNQETAPSETPSATDTAALPAEAVPSATDSASPSGTPSATPSATEAAATPTPTPSASKSAAPAMVSAATPPEAFKQCQVCHSATPGKNGIGPSLAGVYGTKAGEVPGYDFSDAMKNSGLTWNAATLDKYLTSPRDVVPGTKMSFGGLKDADKRKAVIDYLKSL
jgi:cytochrome c2